jgi:hypothetical protein
LRFRVDSIAPCHRPVNLHYKTNKRKIFHNRTTMIRVPLLRSTLALLVFSYTTFLSVSASYSSSIALDLHTVQPSRSQSLRRCTSLCTDLSQATSLDELMTRAESTPIAYSPAHSQGPALQPSKRSSRTHRPPLRFGYATGAQEGVYTRLQTQLYPDMDFK